MHDRYSLRALLVTAFVMSVKTIILTAVDNGTIRMWQDAPNSSHELLRFVIISISTMTWLRAGGPGFDSRKGSISLRYNVQTQSGTTLLLSSGRQSSYDEGKAAGAWSWHYPPSSTKVKNMWSYTSISPYVSTAWYLVRHRGHLYLSIYLFVLQTSVQSLRHPLPLPSKSPQSYRHNAANL